MAEKLNKCLSRKTSNWAKALNSESDKSKKKALALLLLVAIPLCAQSGSQQPASKEALLIANGDYAHFGKLPNPVSDARLLAQSLQKVGFQVTLLENQSREAMMDALQSFQDRVKATRGLALFHYGGHGVQVNGKNYLIPVDADIPDERKVSTRAVDLEEVMITLDAAGSRVNVVVLDACRDNPLPATSTRSASRGLSVVQTQPKNSLIIYAAKAGQKAEDGLFTPTLATVLTQPGLSLSQVMMKVRREVTEKSHGNQTPGDYSELSEDVFLSGGGNDLPPKSQTTLAPQQDTMRTVPPGQKVVSQVLSGGSVSQQDGSGNDPNPLDVVLDYYRDLNQGDFSSAWHMLPSNLQENKKIHPVGFASFRSWFQEITPIVITESSTVEQSANESTVDIQCTFTMKGKPSTMSLRYGLTRDNSLNRWVISSVKMNKQPSQEKLYVSGLNPNGDNWLALKSRPDLNATRLRKLPPATPLTPLWREGEWIKVKLDDGQEGWVYSKYVRSL